MSDGKPEPRKLDDRWYIEQAVVYLQEVASWWRAEHKPSLAKACENYADHIREALAARPANQPMPAQEQAYRESFAAYAEIGPGKSLPVGAAAPQPTLESGEPQPTAYGWTIEQILVYIWQCVSGEYSEQEYPYERFANSEMGQRLRAELAASQPRASLSALVETMKRREDGGWTLPWEEGYCKATEYWRKKLLAALAEPEGEK